MTELVAVLIMFAGAGFLVLIFLGLSWWLGPKKPNPVKQQIFECGNIPITIGERFPVKFYPIAILFVLFDIEIIFLFPWAVVFQEIGMLAFISMTLFIGVLILGLIYAWKKGALQWD
ncbi:MAG: NADH-quinone oxidoreductase subunit A [Calditrichaeota bacterium]|nr:MAG: NADH-quinone oxidoreductase subunit A [Calditrichota bacterium]